MPPEPPSFQGFLLFVTGTPALAQLQKSPNRLLDRSNSHPLAFCSIPGSKCETSVPCLAHDFYLPGRASQSKISVARPLNLLALGNRTTVNVEALWVTGTGRDHFTHNTDCTTITQCSSFSSAPYNMQRLLNCCNSFFLNNTKHLVVRKVR